MKFRQESKRCTRGCRAPDAPRSPARPLGKRNAAGARIALRLDPADLEIQLSGPSAIRPAHRKTETLPHEGEAPSYAGNLQRTSPVLQIPLVTERSQRAHDRRFRRLHTRTHP